MVASIGQIGSQAQGVACFEPNGYSSPPFLHHSPTPPARRQEAEPVGDVGGETGVPGEGAPAAALAYGRGGDRPCGSPGCSIATHRLFWFTNSNEASTTTAT